MNPNLNPHQSSSVLVPHRPSHAQASASSIIVPHKLIDGVYTSIDGNTLYTKNLVPGGTPFFDDDVVISIKDDDGTVVEYREWDPFRSKLAAAILCGVQNIWIKPGSRVLVIYSRDDVRFGTTISHISDLVGPLGLVYVVDPYIFNQDAVPTFAEKRCNIVPIIQGLAPYLYRMLINMVDVLFGTLDTDEQFNKAYMNAMYFLEAGGHYVVCVKANRGDAPFAALVKGERVSQFKKMEHVTLEPFDRDHAYAIGGFRIIDLDEPVTFWTNSFWTEPHLNRGYGGHVTLYEKQKNLPTYMLFDSSIGYALFRAHNVYEFERSYIEIEKYINRFGEVFELIAYHPFESADEAMMYLNAASNDTLPDHLIEFLVKHLPEPLQGFEHSYSLSLPQSSMSHPIVVNANIACSRGIFHDEIMRGVRMHIDTFFEDMKRGELEKAQLDLARKYCRQRLILEDKLKSKTKRGRVQASVLSKASVLSRKKPMRKCQAAAKTIK